MTEPLHSSRRGSPTAVVGVIVALHVLLCATLAVTLNVWLDEAYSLQSTGAGLATAFRRALDFELQPPLYFVLLELWRGVGHGYVFARLLSLGFTALALVIVARFWRRVRPEIHPGWIVAALAFHPFTVYAAVEVRLYGLALMLSAALLALFLGQYASPGGTARGRLVFTVTAVAAVLTQYYMGFLLAAQGAALVVMRRWPAIRPYLLSMGIAGVALAPFAIQVPGQLAGHREGAREPLGLVTYGKFVYQRLVYYVLPRETESPRVVKLARDGAVALAGLALARRVARGERRRWDEIQVASAVVVAALAAGFVMALRITGSQELVMLRHTAALMVPTAVLAFLTLEWAGGRRAVIVGALAMLAFSAADLAVVYGTNPAKRGDWKRVASFIGEREEAGQAIMVFRAPVELPLRWHYRGPNAIVPVPRANDPDRFVLRDTVLESAADVERVIDSLPGKPTRVWLVTDNVIQVMGLDFRHDILEGVVAQRFDVELDQPFFASRVRLLRAR